MIDQTELLRRVDRAMWAGDVGLLSELAPCRCCCHEHTFEDCVARLWNGCRGGCAGGPPTRAEVEVVGPALRPGPRDDARRVLRRGGFFFFFLNGGGAACVSGWGVVERSASAGPDWVGRGVVREATLDAVRRRWALRRYERETKEAAMTIRQFIAWLADKPMDDSQSEVAP